MASNILSESRIDLPFHETSFTSKLPKMKPKLCMIDSNSIRNINPNQFFSHLTTVFELFEVKLYYFLFEREGNYCGKLYIYGVGDSKRNACSMEKN